MIRAFNVTYEFENNRNLTEEEISQKLESLQLMIEGVKDYKNEDIKILWTLKDNKIIVKIENFENTEVNSWFSHTILIFLKDFFGRHYYSYQRDPFTIDENKGKTWKERVQEESKELLDKMGKLKSFTNSEAFLKLDFEVKVLLLEQYKVMQAYNDILVKRLKK